MPPFADLPPSRLGYPFFPCFGVKAIAYDRTSLSATAILQRRCPQPGARCVCLICARKGDNKAC
jgi:hypothetical protein